MNLDDFKSNWQNQKSPAELRTAQTNELVEKMKSFDQNLTRQNWWMSIAFAVTTVFLTGFFFYFKDFGMAFYGTIVGVIVLMALSIWLFWKRKILSTQQDFSQESRQFLEGRIAQLEYNKKITRIYMPIYAIVLTTLIMIYIGEVGQLMERKYQLMAYGITLTYIVLIMIYGMRKQYRKDRETIDPMLEELQEMKKNWGE